MSDYIRREDAIEEIRKAENHAFNSFYKGLVKAHKIVADLPPADVAPVVHAYWIQHENADIICGYYVPSFECSQCGTWKEDDSDYCPDCGAKMDGHGES